LIRIGARGSQLALWQANHIADALRAHGHEAGIEIIRTTGDRLQEVKFAEVGTKGMFIKEIEEALLEGLIDLAVHSLKDLPTELAPEFVLAAIPQRADPRDAFVSIHFLSFFDLPGGAKVGSSSPRRQTQLRAVRPDLEYIEFRGNVDTRLRKLEEGQAQAIILAASGLDRLGRTEWLRQRFDVEHLCPAPGQGALAIECRSGDEGTHRAIAFLDHADTRFAVIAERAALHALGGGCQVPIGVYCRREEGAFRINGVVSGGGVPDLGHVAAATTGLHAEELGRSLAAALLENGAEAILFAGKRGL
jgi:hydroxymethylbilane synthase